MNRINAYGKTLRTYLALMTIIILMTPVTVAMAESLSLDDCVHMALTKNHGLQGIRLDFTAKQMQFKGTQGLAGPKVDLVGNYQWQEKPTAIIPAHGNTIPPIYDDQQKQWGFNLKQTIYDADKTKSLIQYNKEAVNWQQVELKNQTIAVVNNVVKIFYQILQLNDTVKAEKDSVRALSSLMDDIQMKYSVGRVAGVDVLQVEAQLAAEKEKLARYQSGYDRQMSLLKSYICYEQNQQLEVKGIISDYDVASPVTGDIKQNPNVEKKRIQQQQTKELLTSAKADNNVQLSLNGTYRVTAGGSSQDQIWVLGLQLNLPIFDGGVIDSNIGQAKIQLERANESHAQSLVEAEAELVAAQTNADAAKIRIDAARLAWKRAEEAYRIMELSYKTGKTSLTDTLVSQSTATNAEAVYYQAVFDEISAKVDLKTVYGQAAYPIQ